MHVKVAESESATGGARAREKKRKRERKAPPVRASGQHGPNFTCNRSSIDDAMIILNLCVCPIITTFHCADATN